MSRGIVRSDDKHICPKVEPDRHNHGKVSAGGDMVIINDRQAAHVGDYCACEVYDPQLNLVIEGQPDVLVGGSMVARRWDRTSHAGLLVTGSDDVLIGSATLDPIEAAIRRIEASPFGQTKKGKALVAYLRKKHEAGQILLLDPGELTGKDAVSNGWYWRCTRDISIVDRNNPNGDDPDIDLIARTLVHEGTHAKNHSAEDGTKKRSPEDRVADERECWDNEGEFYEDQKEQTSHPLQRNSLDDYNKSSDKEEWLRELYDDEDFDEPDQC